MANDIDQWVAHCNKEHSTLEQPKRSDPTFLYKLLQMHSLDHQEERVTNHNHQNRRGLKH